MRFIPTKMPSNIFNNLQFMEDSHSAADIKFVENVINMGSDGMRTYIKFMSNFPIA